MVDRKIERKGRRETRNETLRGDREVEVRKGIGKRNATECGAYACSVGEDRVRLFLDVPGDDPYTPFARYRCKP